jgi:hypothetical protein
MGLATLASAGVSAAIDATISVGDEVVGAKLLKGWKPNQFIEGPVTAFLAASKKSKAGSG